MAIVIDASVAASWFLPGESSPAADLVLDGLAATQGVVPGLFWHEICSVLIVNERRGRISRERGLSSLARLRMLQLERDDTQDHGVVLEMARKHALSAYDAVYLETAWRRGDTLATLDRALSNAANDENIAVLPQAIP